MATVGESNLNELLEDALEDLLLDDDQQLGEGIAGERAGRPDIDESLKKITQVNEDAQKKLDQGKSEVSDINKSVKDKTTNKTHDTKRRAGQSTTKSNTVDSKVLQGAGCAKSSSSSTTTTKVIDEEEMNRFFASMTEKLNSEMPKMDPSEAQARLSESVPQIFDLMQNLLSKELLYPALKDLSPKFDEWLQKNLATLSKDDRRRYKKQLGKIHEIIDVFDDESLEDQERFEKNLELMEQMQALGAPPEELTVPDGMSKCSIM